MALRKQQKTYYIETPVSITQSVKDISRVMGEMGILPQDYRIRTDHHDGRAGLAFKFNGVHYVLISHKQRNAKDNIRAIYHLIHSRVLNIRKGVESIEAAFGGFIDWLSTPKLPDHVEHALRERGITELPPPHPDRRALEDAEEMPE